MFPSKLNNISACNSQIIIFGTSTLAGLLNLNDISTASWQMMWLYYYGVNYASIPVLDRHIHVIHIIKYYNILRF